MKQLWYSHDPDDGVSVHNTAGEAKAQAQRRLAYHVACGEAALAPADIAYLAWGEMVPHARAARISQTPPSEDSPDGTEEWALVPVEVETERLEKELAEAHATIVVIESWTHEFGAELIPIGTDTYGEGVRHCKDLVARILRRRRMR